jgi:hypothetical protein
MKRKRDETGDNNSNVSGKKQNLQTDSSSQEEIDSDNEEHHDENLTLHCPKETKSDDEGYENSDLPRDVYQCTVLHHAAEKGNAKRCLEILALHPNAVNDTTDLGYIALDLAAMGGHLEAFEVLKDNMTYQEIYNTRPNGNTTLELIVGQEVLKEEHLAIFEMLINGIDDNDIKEYTKELLLAAVSNDHTTISELIIKENPEAIKEVRSIGNYFYNAALIASTKGKEIVKSLITYIPIYDLCVSFFMEQCNENKHAESLKLSTAPCDYVSTLFKDVSQMVSDHICTHDTATYPTIEQSNFTWHFKMLNLYSMMIKNDMYKKYLEESRTNHKEHFDRIDDYIIDNYFMLTGVCKNIKNTPFYLSDCRKQVVSIVLKQLHETKVNLNPVLTIPDFTMPAVVISVNSEKETGTTLPGEVFYPLDQSVD